MNTYVINVSRIVHDLLKGTVTVEANNRAEALEKAEALLSVTDLSDAGQVDSEPAEFEIVSGPEDTAPSEEITGGEWKLGERIWIEDPFHYTKGAQRFRPIESHDENHTATIALVLDDEGDPECEANARLMRASQAMLLNLREAMAYAESLNGGPNGEGARSPDGDDFNELWGWIKASINAYEEGGK